MSAKPESAERFVEIEFVVEPNYAGWRLDKYLCEKIRRLSRTRVQEIIENDLICERRLKPSSAVTAGLTFRLRKRAMDEPETPTGIGELYRDDHLLILDKPAGLPIHPTARYHKGTLVSVLKEKYGEGFAHPAHRLDRETSGIVVCTRTLEASRRLMRSFHDGEVEKTYLAVCEGSPAEDAFAVDAPIAEGGDVIRIAVRIDPVEGKPSRTRFVVKERFSRGDERFAVLACFPETGRQHQIRIHLREAGHPLVGDKIYGPDESYFDRFSKRTLEREAWEKLRLPRHALHAAAVTFDHPVTKRPVTFEAPLPADLADFRAGRPLPPPPEGTPAGSDSDP